MTKSYEILESTSEHKLRITGRDFAELLRHALFAMFDSITPIYADNADEVHCDVTVTALDREQLLIDFLSDALAHADAKKLAFYDATFQQLEATSLQATLIGRPLRQSSFEIKAVTYHGVHITERKEKLSVDIIFDI